MSARIAQLEGRNQELVLIQDEDKRALIQLDDRCKLYQAELEQFRANLADAEGQRQKAKQSEKRAYDEADAAVHEATNYRGDVSFLTKETQRLTVELEASIRCKRDLEDELRRV